MAIKAKRIFKALGLTAIFFGAHYGALMIMTVISMITKLTIDKSSGIIKPGAEAGQLLYNGHTYSQSELIQVYAYHATIIGTILACMVLLIFYTIIFKLIKSDFFRHIEANKFEIKQHSSGFLIGLTAYMPLSIILALTGINKLSPEINETFGGIMNSVPFLLLIIGMGILGSIIEEITFRGLIYTSLSKAFPVIPTILIQAVLFGLLHGNLQQLIYATALGILFGFLRHWSRSTYPAILAHIAFNSFSVIISQIEPRLPENVVVLMNLCLIVVSGVAFSVLLVLSYRKRKIAG